MTLAFFMVHVLHSFKIFDVDLSSDGFDPFVDFPFVFKTTFDDMICDRSMEVSCVFLRDVSC
ncbi:hypothetical protein Hanom_Chr14g01329401 [Helianthus anomalus]